MLRSIKPRTKRAKRELEKRAPKLHENPKKIVLLHGSKTSAVVKDALTELHRIKKIGGQAMKMTKKNDNIRPFEGGMEAPLEFISGRTDCSLFAFGSHSKKRPHNLVLGRMFDHHIYDMIEVGVDSLKPVAAFGSAAVAAMGGSKPCFVFAGEEFENKEEYRQLKSLLLDIFRGEVVETVNLKGLDRVFVVVAAGGKVRLRHCAIKLKKSGSRVPRIELEEMGPSMDLTIRRHRPPSEDLAKEALRSAPKPTKKKVKNVSMHNVLGKVGRIYMPKQEVDKISLSKTKGVKRARREAAAAKKESKQAGPQGETSAKEKHSKKQRTD